MYNFDEIIDRRHTNAMNTDGFRGYIFHADDSMTFPYKDEEFIRMWVADMEFATPEVVIDGIRDRLARRIFGYTRVFEKSYHDAFALWCRRLYDWEFEPEELVTSNGIIPALYELVDHITEPDEKVLFLTLSYAYFKYAADFHSRGFVCSDLNYSDGYYTINFEDLERKAADEKTTLFILCNPHNPSGRVWSEEELQKLAGIIRKYNLWVISDKIHCDLLRTGIKHIPLGKIMPDYGRLVTAMAPSKTFNMAGLMFSNVMIRDVGLCAKWLDRHYNFDNPLSIAAAQAAYEKGEPWLKELKAYLDENFRFTGEYLAEHLPQAVYRISEATYLAWVDLSAYFEPDEVLPLFFAYKAGVLLEGGNMFVQNSDCFIRLNLACPRSVLAAILTMILYGVLSLHGAGDVEAVESGAYNILTIIPCFAVVGLAIAGLDVIISLSIGTGLSCIIGMAVGSIGFFDWAQAVGVGMEDMFWLAVFATLVSGLIELVRYYGGIDWIVRTSMRQIKSRKSCQYVIGLLSVFISGTTLNNAVACLISAPIAGKPRFWQEMIVFGRKSLFSAFSCQCRRRHTLTFWQGFSFFGVFLPKPEKLLAGNLGIRHFPANAAAGTPSRFGRDFRFLAFSCQLHEKFSQGGQADRDERVPAL